MSSNRIATANPARTTAGHALMTPQTRAHREVQNACGGGCAGLGGWCPPFGGRVSCCLSVVHVSRFVVCVGVVCVVCCVGVCLFDVFHVSC